MSIADATEQVPVAPSTRRGVRPRLAFAGTTLVTLVAIAAVLAGALVGYRASYDGRVLPGVRVGSTDLSGLAPDEAAAALAASYAHLGEGRLVLATGSTDPAIPYAAFDRRADVDALVAEALAVGRSGTELEQALAMVHVAAEGVTLEPRLVYDREALASRVALALSALERDSVDATVAMGPAGPVTTSARAGRTFDVGVAREAALAAVAPLDAPAEVTVDVPAIPVVPLRGDDVAAWAATRAERMIADVAVAFGDKSWTIKAGVVRRWVAFEEGAEGAVRPIVLRERIAPALAKIAKKVKKAPVSATFLVAKSGRIVGIAAGRNGRRLDTAATVDAIVAELAHRRSGDAPTPVKVVTAAVEPKLTTAEAEKIAPRMTRLGAWTTRFEISERNYYGQNIWLPARYINGTLLAPGQRLEWFRAVGPIVPSRGFGSGGVIKGDHSEPTGAIGGGMCSSSTTLFNAALRAGLKMGARANHTYYIDRYPLGLDATVWAEGGAVQTMSFTNDMPTPVLVRGWGTRSGGIGWVHYEIWGVPDGRRVTISRPTVENVIPATTREVPTTTLARGQRKQTEWAARGMDVWVTRLVRARSGAVLHRDVYYSHYRKWDGIILVGR
jgi:vancomycin resistance protein YoaR